MISLKAGVSWTTVILRLIINILKKTEYAIGKILKSICYHWFETLKLDDIWPKYGISKMLANIIFKRPFSPYLDHMRSDFNVFVAMYSQTFRRQSTLWCYTNSKSLHKSNSNMEKKNNWSVFNEVAFK